MIEEYTVGDDRELDMRLARYDVEGSLAHIAMLETIGLLTAEELEKLTAGLKEIAAEIEAGRFEIEPGTEDVHSQVELMLTRRLGDSGKKIHSGRSRNDQVLVDLKLFLRDELRQVADAVKRVFDRLQEQSEKYKEVLMPGYTHLQIAMPSSFGLWFGAYAETLADDMRLVAAAWHIANQNPLGSAAGYGSASLYTLQGVDFECVPLKIITDDAEYLDNGTVDAVGMAQTLRTYKGKTSTSCPNVSDWLAAYEGADEVYAITITV